MWTRNLESLVVAAALALTGLVAVVRPGATKNEIVSNDSELQVAPAPARARRAAREADVCREAPPAPAPVPLPASDPGCDGTRVTLATAGGDR